jgi:HD-GYP domain-containing protein (c-di-GMP phosphodiesterase class II)
MPAEQRRNPATLEFFDPESGLRSVPLDRPLFTLGRHRDNDLKIVDNFVSRRHAEIVFDGEGYVFRDNGSSCGSFINGLKTEEKVLENGDAIRLGRREAREINFRWEPAESSVDTLSAESPRVVTVIDETQTRFLNTSLLRQYSSGLQAPPATLKRLSALYEVSSVMLSLEDVSEVSEKLLELVFANVECERAVVMLHDRANAALAQAASRSSVGEGAAFNPSRTVTERSFDENVALLSVDARTDSRFAERESILLQEIRSVMCAPIASQSRVWGVLYVDTVTSKTVFQNEDLEFLLAVARQAGMAMQNLHMVAEQSRTIESFVSALAASIDARDDLTSGHSARVGRLSADIARHMGWGVEECKRLSFAGLLHDYGKIGTREAVLCKPGPLTQEEYEHIKEHASHTMRILSQIHFTEDLQDLPLVASSHHERVDGKGYPLGLKGEQIPLGARIIAVADFFDALSHKRHYREPMALGEVVALIREQAGTAFDPDVVAAFERYFAEEYMPSRRRSADGAAAEAADLNATGEDATLKA